MNNRSFVLGAVTLVVAIAMTSIAPALGEKKEKTEVEGAWKLTKGSKGAPKHLKFSGNQFVLTFDDDRVFKGTFKLNTKENPSWMDLTFVSGPDDTYKGKVALCIYNFDGEAFMWCAAMPGKKRRPPQFVEVMGDVRLLLGTYEKDKK